MALSHIFKYFILIRFYGRNCFTTAGTLVIDQGPTIMQILVTNDKEKTNSWHRHSRLLPSLAGGEMVTGLQTCLAKDKLAMNEMEVGVQKCRWWRVTFPRPTVATSTSSFCWKLQENWFLFFLGSSSCSLSLLFFLSSYDRSVSDWIWPWLELWY